MGEKFVVKCAEKFWDSKKCLLFYPGDQDEVDSMEDRAIYFEGWPPGTEVLTKEKGKLGTRVIPGKPEPKLESEPEPEVEKSIVVDKKKKKG